MVGMVVMVLRLVPKCRCNHCWCRSGYWIPIYRPYSGRFECDVCVGKNTTDDKPLPQISPLEGRLNIRYVADKYNLGLLWRAVAEQNRVSLHQGNIVDMT